MPGLTRLRRRAGGDRGAVTALVAILMSSGVLLGMTAYAVDIGTLYAYRDQALNAANAAALAAAELCNRPGTRCGGLDDAVARANIPGGGVKLQSTTFGDAVCGLDKDTGQLSPCDINPGRAKACFSAADTSTSYAEVHATTTPPDSSTVYPPTFAGSVIPGYNPYGIQVCSRVAWGTPQGPYTALGMSSCDFQAKTGGMDTPFNNGFHAVYDTTVPPRDEVELDLETAALAPTDGCPDLGYYRSSGGCLVNTRQKGSLNGFVNDATSTVGLPTGCRAVLDAMERKPTSRAVTQPYLLIPIYRSITASGAPTVRFDGMVGIAAFQVTGDHLGDEQGTANITGTRDWLSNVSETDYCHANSAKPTDRCIRGYFLWVNLIDGRQPSTQWDNQLGVATYKTVG